MSLAERRLREQKRAYTRRLEDEQWKSEELLLNILPKPIADRLKKGEAVILDSLPEVTVLFADLVGFTAHSNSMSCLEMVRLLNDLFFGFDLLAERHGIEKIKTIGDAYMAVGGLFMRHTDHAEAVADLALAMAGLVRDFRTPSGQPLLLRIGMNSGPVVAGIIGRTKFSYDLWGDTVNTASHMQSHGAPGSIHVTQRTHGLLSKKYSFEDRGIIDVKGKGQMQTYFLRSKNRGQGESGGKSGVACPGLRGSLEGAKLLCRVVCGECGRPEKPLLKKARKNSRGKVLCPMP